MESRVITREQLRNFEKYLLREEKSEATREKYLRGVKKFESFAGGKTVSRYAVRTVGAVLTSVNSLLRFLQCAYLIFRYLHLIIIRYYHAILCADTTEYEFCCPKDRKQAGRWRWICAWPLATAAS